MQRAVWIGGFAIGAILGTVILQSGWLAPAATTVSGSTDSSPELVSAVPAQSTALQQATPQPSAFERLENQVAASHGGRISVGEIIAIARITSSQPGAPTFDQLAAQVSAMQGGRITLGEMLALRGANAQPAASYEAAPPYEPRVSQRGSIGIAQPYYGSSAANLEARGVSGRLLDEAFENRRSRSTYPSAEATAPSSPNFPSPTSPSFSPPISQGLMDTRSGQYMAPAAGGYVDPRNGTFYAQSGPNGVVNTRTGQFIPTH